MKLKTLPVCKLKLRSELDNCLLGRLPPAGQGLGQGQSWAKIFLGGNCPRIFQTSQKPFWLRLLCFSQETDLQCLKLVHNMTFILTLKTVPKSSTGTSSSTHFMLLHCVKSVRIWSYSGPYFPAFVLNTDQNYSKYGNVLCSAGLFQYPPKTLENL